FAEWVANNPHIPQADKEAGMKETNPTSTVLVIEEDGADGKKIPRLFIPLYLTMRIAYLGFNPENTRDQTLQALEAMLPFVKGFAQMWHINDVETLTKTGLPTAKWAARHGFVAQDRELYQLKAIQDQSPEGTVQ